MSLSLDAIEAVLQRREREGVVAEEASDRDQRTEALRDVLATLRQLLSESSETAGLVAQKLADASRDGECIHLTATRSSPFRRPAPMLTHIAT